MTSWDDGSTSMASVDLLSPASINSNNDQPSSNNNNNMIDLLGGGSDDCCNTNANHQKNLEQIEETVEAASALSLTSSSPQEQQQQQHPVITSACQIDFDVEHVGKNKPQSKRMAIWKYGLPNPQSSSSTSSTSDGNNDAATKNNNNHTIQEHEARLVWSTHSGKYTISVDGDDIYTNIAKGSVLEHKFKWDHTRACLGEDETDPNVIPMRIIACRKPPTRSSKDFRCYEFIIGGIVFRDLPTLDGGEPPSPTNGEGGGGGKFENEYYNTNDGKLMSILDVIEPGWRATGFA